MNRRNFLRLVPALITAGIVVPKLLVPKENPSVWGPDVDLKLKNQISTIRNNYIIGCDPVNSEYTDHMGFIIIKKRRGGYSYLYQNMETKEKHEHMLKILYRHYCDRTFIQMKP